ncbi:MAG TPA: hypothetical protein VNZ48_17510 [Xanthobacteraceae bacterium]|jgi:hypothetical protein|nr:hypothetical protein [Xanthobacteraceae bacterium]
MKKQDDAAHGEKHRQETLTPFIERSISELITLFAQLFTTPFAVVTYSKNFRGQITTLARDDIETAYPETVARPLSFFVLLMTAHFLLAGVYWRLLFPAASLSAALAQKPTDSPLSGIGGRLSATWNANYSLFKNLANGLGNAEAFILVAFAFTLIIVVKALLVAMSGRLLRCPIRFETALHASAYAFGTFIFFQYAFITVRVLAALIFGDPGFFWAYAIIAYGSVILAILLVVRVNQIIRQTDGTAELATFSAWFIGTVIWQFAIVLGAIAIPAVLNGRGGFSDYWLDYFEYWAVLGRALYPPAWFGF